MGVLVAWARASEYGHRGGATAGRAWHNAPIGDASLAATPAAAPVNPALVQITVRAVVTGMLIGGLLPLCNISSGLNIGWSNNMSAIAAGIIAGESLMGVAIAVHMLLFG